VDAGAPVSDRRALLGERDRRLACDRRPRGGRAACATTRRANAGAIRVRDVPAPPLLDESSAVGAVDDRAVIPSAGRGGAGKRQGVTVRIWVDLSNSPHVPLLAPIVRHLRGDGHEVVLSARDHAFRRSSLHAALRRGRHRASHAVDGPSLLALADLVVGAGGTMNRESALLGTPTYTVFAAELAAVDAELIRRGLLYDLRDEGSEPRFGRGRLPGRGRSWTDTRSSRSSWTRSRRPRPGGVLRRSRLGHRP
jgi:Protein of unknown function (DUF354)